MRVTVQACIDMAKNDLPVGWLFAAGRERLGYRLPSSLERPKWKFPSPEPPALHEEMEAELKPSSMPSPR